MDPGRRRLHAKIHPLRQLGMALGGVAIAGVLYEQGAGWPSWALCAATALGWPALAHAIARRSRDPYRAELRNLLVDSAIAGAWVPLLHFNLLPSVLLLTLTTVDKISSGVPRLWLRSLPGMGLALLASGLATGFAWSPSTSMAVMLASLPLLLIHTIVVSLASYRLIRQVTKQNHLLDELRRTDTLTGLYGRGHWLEQAEAAHARGRDGGEPAAIVLIDLDHFKQVNDAHGHGAGDDVLRALANAIRGCLRPGDVAGRLGGDEFAVLLPGADGDAGARIAGRIVGAVAGLQFQRRPGIRPTASVGVASLKGQPDLRAWLEAADAALYRAKREGRNRIALAGGAPRA